MEEMTSATPRIVAKCNAADCRWVRMRDGVDGPLPAGVEIPTDVAGIVCPDHRPKITARCACRRRLVDGVWETRPLERSVPLDETLPLGQCTQCGTKDAIANSQ